MPFRKDLWRRPGRDEAARDGLREEDAALRDALDRLLTPFEPWLVEDEPPPAPRRPPARAEAAATVAPTPRRSVRERLVVRYTLPPTLIVALAIAAAMIVFAAPGSPLRPYVVLAFALVCPGSALVRLLAVPDPVLELAAGVGLSIAIQLLASTAMLYAHAWSPEALFALLVVFAVSAASAELLGLVNRPRSAL
jgi:hypothetical protein